METGWGGVVGGGFPAAAVATCAWRAAAALATSSGDFPEAGLTVIRTVTEPWFAATISSEPPDLSTVTKARSPTPFTSDCSFDSLVLGP